MTIEMKTVEKIVRKRENIGNKHFLFFSGCYLLSMIWETY